MKKLEKKRTSRRQSIGKSDPNNDDNTCLQDEEKKHRNNTDHQRKKQKLHNLSDNERITTITMFDDDDNGDENNDNNNNNNDNGSNINNGNDNNNKNNSNDNNNNNNAEKRATVLKPIEGFVEQAPKLMCSKCTQHYIDHHRTHELVRVPIPNTSYPIGAGDSTDNKSSLADADRSGFCYMTHAPKHNIDGTSIMCSTDNESQTVCLHCIVLNSKLSYRTALNVLYRVVYYFIFKCAKCFESLFSVFC